MIHRRGAEKMRIMRGIRVFPLRTRLRRNLSCLPWNFERIGVNHRLVVPVLMAVLVGLAIRVGDATAEPGKGSFRGWNLYRIPWTMLQAAVQRNLPPLTDGGEAEILGVKTRYYYWDDRLEDGRSLSHGFYFVEGKLSLYSKAYDALEAVQLDDEPVRSLYQAAVKQYGRPAIDKPTTAVWLSPRGAENSIVELLLAEVKEPLTSRPVRLYRIMYYGPNFPGVEKLRASRAP